jgi:hypothetical protein
MDDAVGTQRCDESVIGTVGVSDRSCPQREQRDRQYKDSSRQR